MKTRAKGTGSIVPYKDGRFRAFYTDDNGGRPSKIFDKRKDAEKWLREKLHSVDNGTHISPSKIILKNWITEFIELYKCDSSDATLEGYQYSISRLNKYCKRLMNSRLIDIDHPMCQKAVTALRNGNHYRTVEITVSLVKMALNKAVELKMIPFNPIIGTKIKKSLESYGGVEIEPDTLKRIREACMKPLPKTAKGLYSLRAIKTQTIYELLYVESIIGCRTGEIRALKPGDYKNNILRIERALDNANRVGDVKAHQCRSIPITNPTAHEILTRRSRTSVNWLFETSNGTPFDHSNITRTLQTLAPDNTPHDLRHTFITVAVRTGLNLKVISAITGDKVETLLKYYTHVTTDDMITGMKLMDAQIANSTGV